MNLPPLLNLTLEFLFAALASAMLATPTMTGPRTSFRLFLRTILTRTLMTSAGVAFSLGAVHFGIVASRSLGGWPFALAGALGFAVGAAWNCYRANAPKRSD